jgi:hypothetical protein
MVEDKQHLAVFDEMQKELITNLREYNQRANGQTDKEILLRIRTEQNTALYQLLQKHTRVMDYMRGKAVAPEVHFGEAVLLPVGGQG